MPVDYVELSRQLGRFYDFSGKIVLYAGAGGRQLLDLGTPAKRIIAIERDAEALGQLESSIFARGMQESVTLAGSNFEDVVESGDVVYFEFCLHEMDDPFAALVHARSLAPEIVIFDHLPGSLWSFYANEDEDVRRAGEAVERFAIHRRETFETQQRFATYADLHEKLVSQGAVALERIWRDFDGRADIAIPMRYYLALV